MISGNPKYLLALFHIFRIIYTKRRKTEENVKNQLKVFRIYGIFGVIFLLDLFGFVSRNSCTSHLGQLRRKSIFLQKRKLEHNLTFNFSPLFSFSVFNIFFSKLIPTIWRISFWVIWKLINNKKWSEVMSYFLEYWGVFDCNY